MKKLLNNLYNNARTQYALFTFGLMLPNLFMSYTEPHHWATRCVQVLFGFGLFSSLMTIKRRPSRGLYVNFLFVFFAAFQLVLLKLYGNSPISVDMFLNLVATNANEAGELLSNLIVAVILVCTFYIALLALALASWNRQVKMDKQWRKRVRRCVALPAFVGSTALACSLQLAGVMQIHADLYPVNVFYNACMSVYRFVQLKMYDHNAADFTFQAVSQHDASEQETYVFIIGETARSINWSLYGYERQTTPRLQSRPGLITYTDVLSQSNTTHKSVPLLLTPAEAANPSPMYNERSILQAFKEAGFYTFYISNQADNGSLIDHYSHEADVRRYVREANPDAAPDDANLLTALREELAQDKHAKRLVVLHCYGSHFKYCERVPAEYRVFTPCADKQLKAKNREDLINAYDNTMLYNDMIVDSLMTIAAEMPADTSMAHSVAVLFTSDHGEDIYDDERENFLHASPVVSFYQMAVPFVVWCNEAYRTNHADEVTQLQAHSTQPVAPARVVFHTMLGMAGIASPNWQADHSLSHPEFRSGERLFLNDRNEACTLHQLHLTEGDFQQMRSRGMKVD